MKTVILVIAVCVVINATAQAQRQDQERRRFFSLDEAEKIEFWWQQNDVASLAEYADVLSEQGERQKALAMAIRLDLLAAHSNFPAANLGEMKTGFTQILAAMNEGPEREALTAWLRESGLDAVSSQTVTESAARQFEEKQSLDMKRLGARASVRLSRAFAETTQTNTANQIARAWRDPNPNVLLGVAEQRLEADTNDLAGICMKLDYLVFQSFDVQDAGEIERLLSHLKVRYQAPQPSDKRAGTVRKWLNFALPAYEEALAVLKSGNTQEVARVRESFRSAKQNGYLPSAELFRRLDTSKPVTPSAK